MAISLIGAVVDAVIRFEGRTFGDIDLTGATVFSSLTFADCKIASFVARGAQFDGGPLWFSGCVFRRDVDISFMASDRVSPAWETCRFEGKVRGEGLTSVALFSGSTFCDAVELRGAMSQYVNLERCVLDGALDLTDSNLGAISLEDATLKRASRIGPLATSTLRMLRATVEARVHVEQRGGTRTELSGAHLKQGGVLFLEQGEVFLDQLSLGASLRVASVAGDAQPRIRTLVNSDAGKMSFARVDMTSCVFYGAHGLSTIALEPTVRFATAPRHSFGRRYLLDELGWRSSAGRLLRWGFKFDGLDVGRSPRPHKKGEADKMFVPVRQASELAYVYRELRSSLEARSDMAGAADFYVGEMLMRLNSKDSSVLERAMLRAYWALSGFGLSPLLALAWWVLLVVVGSFAMYAGGFSFADDAPVRYALFAVRAAIPGLTTPPRDLEALTRLGQCVEVGLRIGGSVLIALFVLAIRTRLMRKPSE